MKYRLAKSEKASILITLSFKIAIWLEGSSRLAMLKPKGSLHVIELKALKEQRHSKLLKVTVRYQGNGMEICILMRLLIKQLLVGLFH